MKLTWYGHACFLAETEEGRIVFDPYAPGSVPGCRLPALTADAVLCSHGHKDHNYSDGVTLSGKTPAFSVTFIDCCHDDKKGLLRGKNRIAILDAEGLRLVHLGDLGHRLSEKQLAALGKVDVLLLPVGGFYTIDASVAAELAGKVGARVVIPMHYRGEGFGYDVIGPVDEFAERSENVRFFDTNVLEITDDTPPMTAILKCPVRSCGNEA